MMPHHDASEPEDELARAHAQIERLKAEISRLNAELDDQQRADRLSRAFAMAAATGTITSPMGHARLLELIVETAAQVISANAGALFLVDEVAEELTFEVAIGPKADEVKRFRVPLGHGIAGLVAVTGQPMAIADAHQDPRQATDIAQSVGYVPESILCVPLFVHDRVIGVLELLDKHGAPHFSPSDMTALGFFANQAAITIEQSRTQRGSIGLVAAVVASGEDSDNDGVSSDQAGMFDFVTRMEDSARFQQAVELAQHVQEIAWHGDEEAEVCRTILSGFVKYLGSHSVDLRQRGGTLW